MFSRRTGRPLELRCSNAFDHVSIRQNPMKILLVSGVLRGCSNCSKLKTFLTSSALRESVPTRPGKIYKPSGFSLGCESTFLVTKGGLEEVAHTRCSNRTMLTRVSTVTDMSFQIWNFRADQLFSPTQALTRKQ